MEQITISAISQAYLLMTGVTEYIQCIARIDTYHATRLKKAKSFEMDNDRRYRRRHHTMLNSTMNVSPLCTGR